MITKDSNRFFSRNDYYDNSIDPLIPEIWAFESIRILEEEMVMGNLVHRDFSSEIAQFGEIVHTRKPSEFKAVRKTNADNVTDQDVSATDVEVRLNQWIHVSFVIKDGEQTKAFKNLVQVYLEPAMMANARILDQSLVGQSVQFLSNSRGGLGKLDDTTAKLYLIDLDEMMNNNKAYASGRNLTLSANSKAGILKAQLFIAANERGDAGRAMREATVGRLFGFDTYMDINTPRASAGTLAATTTVTGAHVAGDSTIALAADPGTGVYMTIVGDESPLREVSFAAGVATMSRGLNRAVLGGAVVQPYSTGAVKNAAGYANGWVKSITVDGTGKPHVGQLVAFNNTGGSVIRTPEYVIVQVDDLGGGDFDILLDRPLETVLVDNDVVCYGPNGSYNFAFHRNALALVNRPLALPITGTGARSALAEHNGLSMRVVITYDGKAQGHRVTLDSLFGVKTLDVNLGGVLLG